MSEFLISSLKNAVQLLVSFDRDVVSSILLTLKVSLTALFFGGILGLPAGFILGMKPLRARNAIVAIITPLTSIPTVLVGLVLYILFSKEGPLGELNLLFTPTAIIIGDVFLILPLIILFVYLGISTTGRAVWEAAVILGASPLQSFLAVVREAGPHIYCTLAAAFGRASGEIGAAIILGGNIRYFTRTLTTGMTLELAMGELERAMALGIFLVALTVLINLTLLSLRFPMYPFYVPGFVQRGEKG